MNFINHLNTIFLIISYNPDNNIIDLIRVIKKLGYNFIIVDNSENYNENIDKIQNSYSANQIFFNKNTNGISRALNIGFEKAIISHYLYVITLDQDTLFNDNLILIYNQIFQKFVNSNIGAIGVNYNIEYNPKLKYKETFQLINSGTLIKCQAYKQVNGYDENFFIDNVDYDFFLRINIANYKTYKVLNYGIKHKFGSPILLNYLFFKIHFSKYPAARLYHYSFSNIYFIKKYIFNTPIFCLKKFIFFNIYLFNSLFIYKKYELKSILSGFKNSLKKFNNE